MINFCLKPAVFCSSMKCCFTHFVFLLNFTETLLNYLVNLSCLSYLWLYRLFRFEVVVFCTFLFILWNLFVYCCTFLHACCDDNQWLLGLVERASEQMNELSQCCWAAMEVTLVSFFLPSAFVFGFQWQNVKLTFIVYCMYKFAILCKHCWNFKEMAAIFTYIVSKRLSVMTSFTVFL